MELQGRVGELDKQGLGLAVISYDSRETLADFATRHRITYPLLSDQGSATITRVCGRTSFRMREKENPGFDGSPGGAVNW